MVREALTSGTLDVLEPREAAAYFIARRAEGLTTSEEQLLAGWLARDAGHRRVFDSADRAWESFAETEGDEILTAMRAHALAPRRQGLMRWRPAAAAAAVLLVAATAVLVYVLKVNPRPIPDVVTQYASALGEVKELRLPDGSSMTLDADSAASGLFRPDGRTIELRRGRALFAVVPDKARPFVVTAAGRRVTAVGTRFDVNVVVDGLTVTLLEGKVKVDSADLALAPVTLEPGQQYVERLGRPTIRTIGAASENATTWRTGNINFDDQPLIEAAAVMNRYSHDQIVISDPAVAIIRVSGQFRAGDAQRFADTLAELHKLRSVRRGDQIELTRQQ